MRQKDDEFYRYAGIGTRHPMNAIEKWREKYPEDFEGVTGISHAWDNGAWIKPK